MTATTSNLIVRAKQIGVVGAALTVLMTGWVGLGGPVPASMSELDRRDAKFAEQLRSVTILILEGNRELFDTRRDLLNAQRYDIERLPDSSFNAVRLGKIQEDLEQLKKRDDAARQRLEKIQGYPPK